MTLQQALNRAIERYGAKILPFADAAGAELPLPRLLRLSLFQVSVGMAAVLLIGTLNRVMIVELRLPAGLVAVMLALPLLLAPLRALIGFRSDHHRSYLGWRRVPYIWIGTIMQWGGLAIMPFTLILLSQPHNGPAWLGPASAALAFLLVGGGMHTVQTAGLALATDIVPPERQVSVVAMLSLMLLLGMVVSALAFGAFLADFNPFRLVQVIQTCAVVTAVLNLIALWKQEPRNPSGTRHDRPRPSFRQAWATLRTGDRWERRLLAVGLGSAAFAMQDVLLEPYGGEILGMGVGATTALTAAFALGGVIAFGYAARRLADDADPHRIAALGATVGVFAFGAVVFAAPLDSRVLFTLGTVLIGLGGGLFAVGMLAGCMALARDQGPGAGLVLGAWGAAQATSIGLATALGGALRDLVVAAEAHGFLADALIGPAAGYMAVYHLEILLLFATLVVLGPLVRTAHPQAGTASSLALSHPATR
jgi:BCD family chlorophyll transporter-like MFS transporter